MRCLGSRSPAEQPREWLKRMTPWLGLALHSGRSSRQDVFQRRGPGRRLIKLDVTDAPDARLESIDVFGGKLLGHLDLDAEHQLVPLTLRLDLLGGKLRLR